MRLGFWQDGGPVSAAGTWPGAAAFDLDSLGTDRRVMRAREAAFPLLDTADVVSDRFNVTSHKGLQDFPTLLGNVGVKGYTVSPTKIYGDGLVQRAQGRAPASHQGLTKLSATIREQHLPGMVWWTDISHQFPQDFEGNCYARLFAEELTSYAIQYYCPNKSSQCLVAQLERTGPVDDAEVARLMGEFSGPWEWADRT